MHDNLQFMTKLIKKQSEMDVETLREKRAKEENLL